MKSTKPDQTGDKKDKKEERRKKASEGKVGGGTQVTNALLISHKICFRMFIFRKGPRDKNQINQKEIS